MKFEHVLAVAPVSDLAAAGAWYEKLLGREPDNRPMESLLEWRVTDSGWLQVFVAPGKAGGALINFAVQDLDEAVEELRTAGLSPQDPQDASKGVRTSALVDPDGNAITLIGGFRVVY